MVTPIRIFLIFFTVIALLVGLMWLFPEGKIPVTSDFALRFFPKTALTEPGGPEEVDISNIVENVETELPEVETDTAASDTVQADTTEEAKQEIKEVRFVPRSIEYPEGNDTALQTFFRSLKGLKSSGRLIRLLHYGDSQVEGDRITNELRNYFHSHPDFGGCGPGLLPVEDVLQGRLAVKTDQSDNWIKYSSFLENEQEAAHNDFGILGDFYRFQFFPDTLTDTSWAGGVVPDDTVALDSTMMTLKDSILGRADTTTAWWAASKSDMGYPTSRRAEVFRMIYNNNPGPLATEFVFNRQDTIDTLLPPTYQSTVLTYPFENGFSSVKVEMTAPRSPDVYGFALDCAEGIAVDNIGLRGSAVVNFVRMDRAELRRQLQELNVEMVILQFGVNVVPNVVESYGYYERMYYRNLMAFKRAAPDIPVLVVGVSDMARKEGTIYQSYPNIEPIRDAQKNAALRAGYAFWDLYEAMGGKNSMVSWVHHDPPLANDDYTHFSSAGSKIIGKMIYDALMEEYDEYVEEGMP